MNNDLFNTNKSTSLNLGTFNDPDKEREQAVDNQLDISPVKASDTSVIFPVGPSASLVKPKQRTLKGPANTEFNLTDAELKAEQQGVLDAQLDVAHVTDPLSTITQKDIKVTDTQSKLYENLLGVTQHEELKNRVGLKSTDSFTDYYNKTKYIPKGFELEAKLLMEEEKRKLSYSKYLSGEMGYSDFLYEAYGKDIMKAKGHDLSSPLYWYQRYKSGDYTNIFDSNTFLTEILSMANESFQAEKWFQSSTNTTLNNSLMALCTGEKLSADQVRNLSPEFQQMFDTLDDYYDNSEKILQMYKAGYISQDMFNPLIDINDDGKYDYYFHTDGKLYSVEGSSAEDNQSKWFKSCKVFYNDDGSVDRVVTNGAFGTSVVGELLSEWNATFIETFTGIIDLGALLVGGIGAIFGGSEAFQDIYGGWSEVKNSTQLLGAKQTVEFDNNVWEGDNIARGVGFVGGFACGIMASVGIGKAIGAAGQAAGKAASTATSTVAKKLLTGASKAASGVAYTYQVLQGVRGGNVTGQAGSKLAQHAISDTLISAAMLAAQDAAQTAADLSMRKQQFAFQGHELSNADIAGRTALTFGINFISSSLFRTTSNNNGVTARTRSLFRKYDEQANKIIGSITKVGSKNLDDMFSVLWQTKGASWQRTLGGTVVDSLFDVLENALTVSTQSYFSSSPELSAESYFENLKQTTLNPQFLLQSAYIFKQNMGWKLNSPLKWKTEGVMGVDEGATRYANMFARMENIKEIPDTIIASLRKLAANYSTKGEVEKVDAINNVIQEYSSRISSSESGGNSLEKILNTTIDLCRALELDDSTIKDTDLDTFFDNKETGLAFKNIRDSLQKNSDKSSNLLKEIVSAVVTKDLSRDVIARSKMAIEEYKYYYQRNKDIQTAVFSGKYNYTDALNKWRENSKDNTYMTIPAVNRKLEQAISKLASNILQNYNIEFDLTNTTINYHLSEQAKEQHTKISLEPLEEADSKFNTYYEYNVLENQSPTNTVSNSEIYKELFVAEQGKELKKHQEANLSTMKQANLIDDKGNPIVNGGIITFKKGSWNTGAQTDESFKTLQGSLKFLASKGLLIELKTENEDASYFLVPSNLTYLGHLDRIENVGVALRELYILSRTSDANTAQTAATFLVSAFIRDGVIDETSVPKGLRPFLMEESVDANGKKTLTIDIKSIDPSTLDEESKQFIKTNISSMLVEMVKGDNNFLKRNQFIRLLNLFEIPTDSLNLSVGIDQMVLKNYLDIYNKYINSIYPMMNKGMDKATNQERKELVAFLKTLSGSEESIIKAVKYLTDDYPDLNELIPKLKDAYQNFIQGQPHQKMEIFLKNISTYLKDLSKDSQNKILNNKEARATFVNHIVDSLVPTVLAINPRNIKKSIKNVSQYYPELSKSAHFGDNLKRVAPKDWIELKKKLSLSHTPESIKKAKKEFKNKHKGINDLTIDFINKPDGTFFKDVLADFFEISYDRNTPAYEEVLNKKIDIYHNILKVNYPDSYDASNKLINVIENIDKFSSIDHKVVSDQRETLTNILLDSIELYSKLYDGTERLNLSNTIVINLHTIATKNLDSILKQINNAEYQQAINFDREKTIRELEKRLSNPTYYNELTSLMKLQSKHPTGVVVFNLSTEEGLSEFKSVMTSLGYSEGEILGIQSGNRSNIQGVEYYSSDRAVLELTSDKEAIQKIRVNSNTEYDFDNTKDTIDMTIGLVDYFGPLVDTTDLNTKSLKELQDIFNITISSDNKMKIESFNILYEIALKVGKSASKKDSNFQRSFKYISEELGLDKATIDEFKITSFLNLISQYAESNNKVGYTIKSNTEKQFEDLKTLIKTNSLETLYDITYDNTNKTLRINNIKTNNWTLENIINILKKNKASSLQDLLLVPSLAAIDTSRGFDLTFNNYSVYDIDRNTSGQNFLEFIQAKLALTQEDFIKFIGEDLSFNEYKEDLKTAIENNLKTKIITLAETSNKVLKEANNLSDEAVRILSNSTLRNKLANAIQQELISKGYSNFGKVKVGDSYEQVNSQLDINKIFDSLKDFSGSFESVQEIISKLTNYIIISDNTDALAFAKYNPYTNLLSYIIENNGKYYISLEALENISLEEYKVLEQLNLLTPLLKSKLQDLEILDKEGKYISPEDISTSQRAPYNLGTEITEMISPGLGIVNTKKARERMITNIQNSIKRQDRLNSRKTTKLSALLNNTNEEDILVSTFKNFFGNYMKYTDNKGSIKLTNFNSRIARGAMIYSVSAFANSLLNLKDQEDFKASVVLSPEEATKVALSIYGTTAGTDESNQYTRYTIVYRDENNNLIIEPLAQRMGGDQTNISLGRNLLERDLLSDKYKNAILITADKNAMTLDNSAYGQDVMFTPLNDSAKSIIFKNLVEDCIEIYANNKWIQDPEIKNDDYDKQVARVLSSYESKVDAEKHYVKFLTDSITSKFISTIDPSLRQQYIDQISSLAYSTLDTVESLQAASPSFTKKQEALYNFMVQSNLTMNGETLNNNQKVNLVARNTYDAFTYFLNYASLPETLKVELFNYARELKESFHKEFKEDLDKTLEDFFYGNEEEISNATNHINNYINSLSSDTEKLEAVQNIFRYKLLTSERGKDLQALFMASDKYLDKLKDKSLNELKENEINLNEFDNYSEVIKEVKKVPLKDLLGSSKTIIGFDLENFFKQLSNDNMIYEISFVKYSHGTDDLDFSNLKDSKKYTIYFKYKDTDINKVKQDGYEYIASDEAINAYFNSKDEVKANTTIKVFEIDSSKGDTKEQILKYLESTILEGTTKENITLIGHNSKLTDLKKLETFFGRKTFLNELTHLDVLNDMLKRGGYSDMQTRQLKASLEAIRKSLGEDISKAHTSLDDAEFTIKLAYLYSSGLINVDKLTSGLYRDLTSLLTSLDFTKDKVKDSIIEDTLYKNIFKTSKGEYVSNYILKTNANKSDSDFIRNYQQYGDSLDSILLNQMLQARNSIDAIGDRKYASKKYKELVENFSKEKSSFFDYLEYEDGQKTLLNLFSQIIPDNSDLSFETLNKAADIFVEIYYSYKKTLPESKLDFLEFLSLPEDTLKELLSTNKKLVNNPVNKKSLQEKLNLLPEEINKRRKEFTSKHSIYSANLLINNIMDELGLEDIKGTSTYNNILRIVAAFKSTDFNKDYKKSFEKKLNTSVKINNETLNEFEDYIEDSTTRTFSRQYLMTSGFDVGQEVKLSDGTTHKMSSTEIGLTPSRFKALMGYSYEETRKNLNISEGEPLYIQIDRMPGARQGVIHTYKLILLDESVGYAQAVLTPDIFYAYHSGDFDSDKIAVLKPNAYLQRHGKDLMSFQENSWKVLDSILNIVNKGNYDISELHDLPSDKELYTILTKLNNNTPLDTSEKEIADNYFKKVSTISGKEEIEGRKYYSLYIKDDDINDIIIRQVALDNKLAIPYVSVKDSSTGFADKNKRYLKGTKETSEDLYNLSVYSQIDLSKTSKKKLILALQDESTRKEILDTLFNTLKSNTYEGDAESTITTSILNNNTRAMIENTLDSDSVTRFEDAVQLIISTIQYAETIDRTLNSSRLNSLYEQELESTRDAETLKEIEILKKVLTYKGVDLKHLNLSTPNYKEMLRLKRELYSLNSEANGDVIYFSPTHYEVSKAIKKAARNSRLDLDSIKLLDKNGRTDNSFKAKFLLTNDIAVDTAKGYNTDRFSVTNLTKKSIPKNSITENYIETLLKLNTKPADKDYNFGSFTLKKGERVVAFLDSKGEFSNDPRKISFIVTQQNSSLAESKLGLVGSGSLKVTLSSSKLTEEDLKVYNKDVLDKLEINFIANKDNFNISKNSKDANIKLSYYKEDLTETDNPKEATYTVVEADTTTPELPKFNTQVTKEAPFDEITLANDLQNPDSFALFGNYYYRKDSKGNFILDTVATNEINKAKKKYSNVTQLNDSNGLMLYRVLLISKLYDNCSYYKNKISKQDFLNNIMSKPELTGDTGAEIIFNIFKHMTEQEEKALGNTTDKLTKFLLSYDKFTNNSITAATFEKDTPILRKTKDIELYEKDVQKSIYPNKKTGPIYDQHIFLKGLEINGDKYKDVSHGYYSQIEFLSDMREYLGKDRLNNGQIENLTTNGVLNLVNASEGTYGDFIPHESRSSVKQYGSNPMEGKQDPKSGAGVNMMAASQTITSSFRNGSLDLQDYLNLFKDNEEYYGSSKHITDSYTLKQSEAEQFDYNDYKYNNKKYALDVLSSLIQTKSRLGKAQLFRASNDAIDFTQTPRHWKASSNGIYYTYEPSFQKTTFDDFQKESLGNYSGWFKHSLSQEYAKQYENSLKKFSKPREEIHSEMYSQRKDFKNKYNQSIADLTKAFSKENGITFPKHQPFSKEEIEESRALSRSISSRNYKNKLSYGYEDESYYEDYISRIANTSYSKYSNIDMQDFKKALLSTSGINIDSDEALRLDRSYAAFVANRNQYRNSLLGADYIMLHKRLERTKSLDLFNKYTILNKYLSDLDYLTSKLDGIQEGKRYRSGTLSYNKKELIESINLLKQKLGGDVDAAIKMRDALAKSFQPEIELMTSITKKIHESQLAYAKEIGEPFPEHLWLVSPNVYKNKKLNKALGNKATEVISKLFGSRTKKQIDSAFTYTKDLPSIIEADINNQFDFFKTTFDLANETGRLQALLKFSKELKETGAMSNSLIFSEISSIINKTLNLDTFKDIGSKNVDAQEDTQYASYVYAVEGANTLLEDNRLKISYDSKTTVGQKFISLYQDLYVNYIEPLVGTRDISFDSLRAAADQNPSDIDAVKAIKAYHLMFDIVGNLVKLSKNTGIDIIESIYSKVIEISTKTGTILSDRFGRKYEEDVSQFQGLSHSTLEDFVWRVEHSNLTDIDSSTSYKRSVVLDVLGGNAYLLNKNVSSRIQPLFVKRDKSLLGRALDKTRKLATQLIMSNPIKLPSRLVNFTMFDFCNAMMSNPEFVQEIPESVKELGAYISSKGTMLPEDLREFIRVTNNDPLDSSTGVYMGEQIEKGTGLLQGYFEKMNIPFQIQNVAVRYILFKSLKKSLKNVGNDPIQIKKYLGSSYYLKDKIMSLQGETYGNDSDIKHISKEAKQAAFLISNQFGTFGDMPYIASQMGRLGLVFTTFPMALGRFAKNEILSMGSVIKEIFTGQADSGTAKYISKKVGGLLEMCMTTWLLNYIILSLTTDMDEEEKWKEVIEEGASVDLTRTLITGDTFLDKSAQWNPYNCFKTTFVDPILDPIKDDEEENKVSSVMKSVLNNYLYSHTNPFAKSFLDAWDDFPLNNYKNSGTNYMDNLNRKLFGIAVGSSASNAFISTMQSTKFDDDLTFSERLRQGIANAIKEEAGNSQTYKSNWRNYNNALYTLNTYIYSDLDKSTNPNYLSSEGYNADEVNSLKTKLKNAIKSKASPKAIYNMIIEANQSGMSTSEIRSALRAISIRYKLESISDLDSFYDTLSETELVSIKQALAYEETLFPIIYDTLDEINSPNNYNNSTGYYFNRAGINLYNNYQNYNYRTNYSNLYKNNNYYYRNYYGSNSSNYNTNYSKYKNSPTSIYSNMMNEWKYGKSTDIWGNRYSRYTNQQGNTWTYGGNN